MRPGMWVMSAHGVGVLQKLSLSGDERVAVADVILTDGPDGVFGEQVTIGAMLIRQARYVEIPVNRRPPRADGLRMGYF